MDSGLDRDPFHGRVVHEYRASASFGGEQHTVVHVDVQERLEILDESVELAGREAVGGRRGCVTLSRRWFVAGFNGLLEEE
jgi:hypothetical protein